ncbi:hypothetical protein [Catenulispora rubra]|uniref:hypothetical protein n=1 Tax=Catenulispora rubra TaxID=280293 RepID=UPI001891F43A|nr:hypothetical protein [Catenulispora rubra]
MNVTAHPAIPGLYNGWGDGFFSTIRAMNLPEGRCWRTHAYRTEENDTHSYLGDFASRDAAATAIAEWFRGER